MAKPKPDVVTCSECGQFNCYRHETRYPAICATEDLAPEERAELVEIYGGDSLDAVIARAAAEIEAHYYCQLNRIEETVAFARRIGAKRIGIATCVGLIDETKILVDILRLAGFETRTALCKVGSIDKTEIGIPENLKIKCGHEACCNPILQARLLNRESTQLNLIMGLCVGHDFAIHPPRRGAGDHARREGPRARATTRSRPSTPSRPTPAACSTRSGCGSSDIKGRAIPPDCAALFVWQILVELCAGRLNHPAPPQVILADDAGEVLLRRGDGIKPLRAEALAHRR